MRTLWLGLAALSLGACAPEARYELEEHRGQLWRLDRANGQLAKVLDDHLLPIGVPSVVPEAAATATSLRQWPTVNTSAFGGVTLMVASKWRQGLWWYRIQSTNYPPKLAVLPILQKRGVSAMRAEMALVS